MGLPRHARHPPLGAVAPGCSHLGSWGPLACGPASSPRAPQTGQHTEGSSTSVICWAEAAQPPPAPPNLYPEHLRLPGPRHLGHLRPLGPGQGWGPRAGTSARAGARGELPFWPTSAGTACGSGWSGGPSPGRTGPQATGGRRGSAWAVPGARVAAARARRVARGARRAAVESRTVGSGARADVLGCQQAPGPHVAALGA